MTNVTDWDALPCFNSSSEDPEAYTRMGCYRVALLTFAAAIGPFVFFNVQKTKYLQLFTTGMRWLGMFFFNCMDLGCLGHFQVWLGMLQSRSRSASMKELNE